MANFGQRILGDRDSQSSDLLQPMPTASYLFLLLMHSRRILQALVERAFHDDGRKPLVDDKLRLHRIAAEVSFASVKQLAQFDQPEDVSQVQIAVGDLGDLFATDFAEVALIAEGHVGFGTG